LGKLKYIWIEGQVRINSEMSENIKKGEGSGIFGEKNGINF
jgi:hypothetical protein